MSNIPEFADIPSYSVTNNMTLQDALDVTMEAYTKEYKEVYAKAPPLNSADPMTLVLKTMAMLHFMDGQTAERRMRALLLKDAEGAELDNYGLPFGVMRNQATYATVTIRFTLSAEQKTVVAIVQGTRVRTAAGVYFATTEYAQIPIGEMSVDVVAKAEETACINCARCVEVCPSRIIPSRLADLALRHDEDGFVAMNGLECVECGSCSYVCPAKRPLKQAIGSMRRTALANKRKK